MADTVVDHAADRADEDDDDELGVDIEPAKHRPTAPALATPNPRIARATQKTVDAPHAFGLLLPGLAAIPPGAVAHLVERLNGIQEVTSSTLVSSTKI